MWHTFVGKPLFEFDCFEILKNFFEIYGGGSSGPENHFECCSILFGFVSSSLLSSKCCFFDCCGTRFHDPLSTVAEITVVSFLKSQGAINHFTLLCAFCYWIWGSKWSTGRPLSLLAAFVGNWRRACWTRIAKWYQILFRECYYTVDACLSFLLLYFILLCFVSEYYCRWKTTGSLISDLVSCDPCCRMRQAKSFYLPSNFYHWFFVAFIGLDWLYCYWLTYFLSNSCSKRWRSLIGQLPSNFFCLLCIVSIVIFMIATIRSLFVSLTNINLCHRWTFVVARY